MSLNRSKSFVKKTRKGNVVKVLKEHYLRDDIDDGVGTVLEEHASCYIIRTCHACARIGCILPLLLLLQSSLHYHIRFFAFICTHTHTHTYA